MSFDDKKILAQLMRHEKDSIEDPFTHLLDSYLIKRKKKPGKRLKEVTVPVREEVRPGGRLSPSSIGGCQRQAVFRFLGVDGQLRINPDTELIFEHGHWIHRKWQTIFQDMQAVMGIKRIEVTGIERKIQIPKLYIAGALDAGLILPESALDGEVVVDVKSINERGWARITDDNAPIAEHVQQLTTYCKSRKAKWGLLLYENKNTQRHKVFVFRVEKKVWTRVKLWAEEVIDAMLNERVPDMHEGCEQGNFLYEKCPYKNICFGSESVVKIQKRAYAGFEGLDPLWEQGLREAS